MKKRVAKKGVTICFILLFCCTCCLPSLAQQTEKKPLSTSQGDWLYVGGNGPGNYSKIQDAVDNASDGNTVFVYDDSSPYYEHVTIDKSITLLGENRVTTIIDANMTGSPIVLEAGNVMVQGFTIQNSGNQCYENAGIFIRNSVERSWMSS